MLNKAQVIGNIGQDPKVTQLSNGNGQMASFSVATTEKGYTTQRGVQVPERTEWHNIVVFGRLADVAAKFLHKGSKVYVEGKMRTRKYTDRNNVERYITEINAESLEMFDPKPQTATANYQQQAQPQTHQYGQQPSTYNGGNAPQVKDDDLPF